MRTLLNTPLAVLLCAFGVLCTSSLLGVLARRKFRPPEESKEDLDFVVGAILTLLGLLIGFTFSMAIGRYDQRKNYEEEEANAIGTEYVRVDLLQQPEAFKIKDLLAKYLDRRIEYYKTHGWDRISELDSQTTQLQNEMWARVTAAATADPSPVTAIVVTGMNDVLNRQGYTQAAWWNRLPVEAWGLMGAISIVCSSLVGYAARSPKGMVFMVVPFVVSISFLLIADIDSPRGGLIRVAPQNLISLEQSLRSQ
jgi:hypothetical protein